MTVKLKHLAPFVFSMVLALGGTLHAADLVRDGKATAVIALPADPNEHESKAASELIDYVEKMSGAKIETVVSDPAGLDALLKEGRREKQTIVCIGRLAQPRLQKVLDTKKSVRGSFALQSTADFVLAAGIDEGTYYAAMELLEQQGVRWFMPGDLGTVIPTAKTITVADQEMVQAPSFETRYFQMPNKDWQARMRCGGPTFPSAHGLDGVPPFEKNPEYFALVKGQRTKRQHCLSNPKVLEAVVTAL